MSEMDGSEESTDAPLCGTVAAISRHKRRGEDLDPDCREAQRLYHERRRAEGPKRESRRTITARETMAVREKARRILGERHPAELVEIMKELRAERAEQDGKGQESGSDA